MKKLIVLSMWKLLLITISVSADQYYVNGGSGNDTNTGTTSGSAFKTIQKCVEIAQAGDTCNVASGVYRETVKTKRNGSSTSPIKLLAQSSDNVVITGTDKVSGWSAHSGHIYKADVGKKTHQLFVFGGSDFYDFGQLPSVKPSELMIEARYPNLGYTLEGMYEKTEDGHFTRIKKSGNNGLTVTNLPKGNYAGAHVYAYGGLSNRRWWSNTAIVSSNSGNVLTTSTNMAGWINTASGTAGAAGGNGNYDGYVYGSLDLLDTASEWASKNNKLYFWAPDNANPRNLNVEAKTRLYTFKLEHNYIEVEGFKVFGGATLIKGSHIVLNNMEMRYFNSTKHVQAGTSSKKGVVWSWPYTTSAATSDPISGVRFQGSHSTLKNSTLYYAMGEGITLAGNSNTIENNTISYTNTMGHYAHGIQIVGDDNDVIGNTMRYTARSHVRLHHTPSAERWRVNYNDLSINALINHDVGMITAWGVDSNGSEIAYNWAHQIGPNSFGIYMDNNNSEILIHHNVVWETSGNGYSIILLVPQEKIYVYNNTVQNGINKGWHNPDTGPDRYNQVQIYNNFYTGSLDMGNYYYKGCCNYSGNTNWYWTAVPSADTTFNKLAGTKNRGYPIGETVYSGKTYPSVTQYVSDGKPDAGAYETGGAAWRPGVDRIENSSSTVRRDAYRAIQAEHYDHQSGLQSQDFYRGKIAEIANIQSGDWAQYNNIDFGDDSAVDFQVQASAGDSGGYIEIRQGSSTGTVLGRCAVYGTGSWSAYSTTSCSMTKSLTGKHNIVLKFTGPGNLMNVDWFRFRKVKDKVWATSRIEAEDFDGQTGIGAQTNNNIRNVGYIQNGDWTLYKNIHFETYHTKFIVRTSSAKNGGKIVLRKGSVWKEWLGECAVPGTGSWSTYTTTTCQISLDAGSRDIVLQYTGSGDLMNVDWFKFGD